MSPSCLLLTQLNHGPTTAPYTRFKGTSWLAFLFTLAKIGVINTLDVVIPLMCSAGIVPSSSPQLRARDPTQWQPCWRRPHRTKYWRVEPCTLYVWMNQSTNLTGLDKAWFITWDCVCASRKWPRYTGLSKTINTFLILYSIRKQLVGLWRLCDSKIRMRGKIAQPKCQAQSKYYLSADFSPK